MSQSRRQKAERNIKWRESLVVRHQSQCLLIPPSDTELSFTLGIHQKLYPWKQPLVNVFQTYQPQHHKKFSLMVITTGNKGIACLILFFLYAFRLPFILFHFVVIYPQAELGLILICPPQSWATISTERTENSRCLQHTWNKHPASLGSQNMYQTNQDDELN